jgi:ParB family chromosome partitioning protein
MILGRQSGLGRGLGAMIPPKPISPPPQTLQPTSEPAVLADGEQRVIQIPIEAIERNPHQPRIHFDHAQLEDLISSIKEHGVIQPIVVTKQPDGRYQLIAGERRLRASTIAGLKTIPALVREANEQQKLELAIIENIQRQDLNPIEEAKAYIRLMEEFGMTQDDVGKKVGKSRPQVGNIVRLLQLPEEIQHALAESRISASNARTLLSLPTDAERLELFRAMLAGNFTVRQTEEIVGRPRRVKLMDPNVMAAEDALREKLHCKVQIKRDPSGKGEIKMQFTSDEEFNALIEKLSAAS